MQYGYCFPNNHDDTVPIDHMNTNTKWQDAEKFEFDAMLELSVFESQQPPAWILYYQMQNDIFSET
jgi:hypothetical protein